MQLDFLNSEAFGSLKVIDIRTFEFRIGGVNLETITTFQCILGSIRGSVWLAFLIVKGAFLKVPS